MRRSVLADYKSEKFFKKETSEAKAEVHIFQISNLTFCIHKCCLNLTLLKFRVLQINEHKS